MLHLYIKTKFCKQEIQRPVLVLNITDGTPSNSNAVKQTILNCRNFCANTKYGENAVAFSFAQIGSDRSATEYLGQLDTDSQVGHLIDCTSEFLIEKEECGAGFTEADAKIRNNRKSTIGIS